jgi:hypothetical protein
MVAAVAGQRGTEGPPIINKYAGFARIGIEADRTLLLKLFEGKTY